MSKSCCQAQEKPRQRQVTIVRTQSQGIGERVRFQNQISGAGEGMSTESQHFGDWAALMPKPESGIVPEDSDGAEFNGIFQG